jgi:bla regulator protein BlaR1
VENQNSKMHYNGGKYPFEAWEKDMGLKEAFQTSCVWYFRQLIDAVDEENMKKDIDALGYGNCDISEWNGNEENGISDTTGFWLASSLQISPRESVDVVANIFEGKTDYSQADIEILSDVMQSDVSGIYGKTGTAKDNKAWYTGYCTTENGNIYFSVYISDCTDKSVAGADAKQIAVNIINDNYILAN